MNKHFIKIINLQVLKEVKRDFKIFLKSATQERLIYV